MPAATGCNTPSSGSHSVAMGMLTSGLPPAELDAPPNTDTTLSSMVGRVCSDAGVRMADAVAWREKLKWNTSAGDTVECVPGVVSRPNRLRALSSSSVCPSPGMNWGPLVWRASRPWGGPDISVPAFPLKPEPGDTTAGRESPTGCRMSPGFCVSERLVSSPDDRLCREARRWVTRQLISSSIPAASDRADMVTDAGGVQCEVR